MDYKLAIAVIKDNFPSAQNATLCEALNTAIQAMEENAELKARVKGLENLADTFLPE